MLVNRGKFRIGHMDRHIQILIAQEGKGALSEAAIVEVPLKSVWATVDYGSGGEDFDEKVYTLENRMYTIHYDPVIVDELMQKLIIEDEGDRWYVYATDLLGRQYIVLKAERRD